MNEYSITDPHPGIYKGVTDADYHATTLCSNSNLGKIDLSNGGSPAKLIYELASAKTEVLKAPHTLAQANLDIGTALHTALLQPDLLDDHIVRLPELDLLTKVGKAALAEIQEANPGKIYMRPGVWDVVQGMIDAVNNSHHHAKTRDFLSLAGDRELTVIGTTVEDSPLCKARIDLHAANLGYLVDLKTTQDASPKGFGKSAANFRYYRQAAFYMDMCRAAGIECSEFIFMAIEKTAPYLPGIYRVTESQLMEGRREYKELLHLYGMCLDDDNWPGYNTADGIDDLVLPGWTFNNQN